jgi:pyruvate formate lyase activating enzyme
MGKVKYDNLGLDYPLKDEVPPSKERVKNAKQILGVIRND